MYQHIVSFLAFSIDSIDTPRLRFKDDGTFRIVQFTDLHYGRRLDARTRDGMNLILDRTTPDLVIASGDCVPSGDCDSIDDILNATAYTAAPMEERSIPWAITFGNHENDKLDELNLAKDDFLTFFINYPCNLNKHSSPEIFGSGNDVLLIGGSKSESPIFGVWLIDSNSYSPEMIGGQKLGGYGWIRFSQIRWYWDRSVELEMKYGKKIPSLMFFHMPLREFIDLRDSGNFVGEVNEDPCPPQLNSGLFTAMLERGDVKGVFVGHEHINTYVGDRYGIKLGYSGGIGYSTYGLRSDDEIEKNRLRGARIFDIREDDPSSFHTEYITVDSLCR